MGVYKTSHTCHCWHVFLLYQYLYLSLSLWLHAVRNSLTDHTKHTVFAIDKVNDNILSIFCFSILIDFLTNKSNLHSSQSDNEICITWFWHFFIYYLHNDLWDYLRIYLGNFGIVILHSKLMNHQRKKTFILWLTKSDVSTKNRKSDLISATLELKGNNISPICKITSMQWVAAGWQNCYMILNSYSWLASKVHQLQGSLWTEKISGLGKSENCFVLQKVREFYF